jgi:hypothetical protein
VNTAGADDVTPDAEGDVVLAAQPGQRMQNPRIGGACWGNQFTWLVA